MIDASAALSLASSAPGFDPVQADLVAPALLWSEVTSRVRSAVWRGDASPALAKTILERVLSARIGRRSGDELYRRASDVARAFGWAKTYDAEYVALAQIQQSPLLTLDLRLRRRVGSQIEWIDLPDVLA